MGECVRRTCPAKVNLFLEILGRRPDGFHEQTRHDLVAVAVRGPEEAQMPLVKSPHRRNEAHREAVLPHHVQVLAKLGPGLDQSHGASSGLTRIESQRSRMVRWRTG